MIKNLVEQEQLKEQLKEVNDDIKALNTDVNAVEDETLYARNGGSFMGANSNNTKVYENIVSPNESKEIPINLKDVVQSHDKALKVLKNHLYPVQNIQSLNVNHIYLEAGKTKVTMKFKNSSSWGFFFGRDSSNKPLCASIAYSEIKNLGSSGAYSVSEGVVTMTLNTYSMGFLLSNGNIEYILYS